MEVFAVQLRGAASNQQIAKEAIRKLELQFGIGCVVDQGRGKLLVLRTDEEASRLLSSLSEVESIEFLVSDFAVDPSSLTTVQERAKQARKSVIINLKNSTTSILSVESAILKDGLWLAKIPDCIGSGETVTFATVSANTVIGGIEGVVNLKFSESPLANMVLKWTHVPLDAPNYKYQSTHPYHVSKTSSFGEMHSEASFTVLEIAPRHIPDNNESTPKSLPIAAAGENAVPELIGEQFDRGEESWKMLLGKHARSVLATIVNRSEATLQLKNQTLVSGRWVCSPPDVIFPNSTVAFGVVSGGSLVSIDGRVEYELDNADSHPPRPFSFIFRNPLIGNNAFGVEVPPGFDKDCTSAHRAAAIVRFTVMDNFHHDPIQPPSQPDLHPPPASSTPNTNASRDGGVAANSKQPCTIASWHPLRILTLNVALLEPLGELSVKERAEAIAGTVSGQLGGYDVVMLQGAFDEEARRVLRDGLVKQFTHLVPYSKEEESCGMVVASKHKVQSYSIEMFEPGIGPDKNVAKGVLSVLIQSAAVGVLCLVSTDLQCDPDDSHAEWETLSDKHNAVRAVRMTQMTRLSQIISVSFGKVRELDAKNHMVILGGCLRVEAEEEGGEDGLRTTEEYGKMIAVLEGGEEGMVMDLYRTTHPNLSDCGYTWDFTQNSLVDHSVHFFVRDSYCLAFHRPSLESSTQPPNVLWSDVVPLGSTVESRLSPHFAVAALLRPQN